MGLTAYYLDEPDRKVDTELLDRLGVVHWNLDPTMYENDPELEKIREERGYTYVDYVDSSKMPNLQDKINTFLIEHLHEDEEIRYFLNGSGYFDLRNEFEEKQPWIRIHGKPGDLIVLPAGIYHRFLPDEKMYFHVMRLFVGEPVWTPYNREDEGTDAKPSRSHYVSNFIKPSLKQAGEQA